MPARPNRRKTSDLTDGDCLSGVAAATHLAVVDIGEFIHHDRCLDVDGSVVGVKTVPIQ